MTPQSPTAVESDSQGAAQVPPRVAVLHGPERTQAEVNAAKLVEQMGGDVDFVRLPDDQSSDFGHWVAQTLRRTIVVASAGTLAATMPEENQRARWISELTAATRGAFVFGFANQAGSEPLLKALTSGAYESVEHSTLSAGRFEVAGERAVCGRLSGMSFRGSAHETDGTFVQVGEGRDCTELIRFEGKAHSLAVRRGDARLLLTASTIADVDEPVEQRAPMRRYFSRLAPLLVFLRWLCGDTVWHGDTPRACWILDDPLLKPRYGFLEFDRLLALSRTANFSANIAFIPWNYRRSNARVAELFRQFPSRLSLSIHGCEHTGAEFASTNFRFLQAQACRGLEWMAKHRDLTGVPFDDVMVFPQGRFSKPAITALQSSGYLAAANSTGRPMDGAPNDLLLRDLLEVAVTRFDGFPIFVRHYPNDIADIAVDLFLGKPGLLVEHHGFFKDGYGPFEECVATLNSLEPRLEWTNLTTLCSTASFRRNRGNGHWDVRFFTDRFQLTNTSNQPRRYTLTRRQTGGTPPTAIKLNGVSVDRTPLAGESALEVELAAGATIDVLVVREQQLPPSSLPPRDIRRRTRVFVRRHLSEFRDHYLDRNPFLKRLAAQVYRRLTGAS